MFFDQSSIKSDGYRCLAEGEEVEYEVKQGGNGLTKAADVTGPGGLAIQGDCCKADGGFGGRGLERGRRGYDFNRGCGEAMAVDPAILAGN